MADLGRSVAYYEEAIGLYEQVLAKMPGQPKVWMSYGHTLKTAGRQHDSIEAYRKSIELAPNLGESYWSLANLKTYRFKPEEIESMRTQLAPTSGAMGYGVPAAVAAKIVHPDRTVICFAGDGDFLMSGQELATAVQYDAPVVVVILNNGMYGTIRMHQEKHYPGRVSGTELKNPHFAAFARSFGAMGEIVEDTAQFGPAYERIVASGKAGVIDIHLDPQAITPNTTLDKIRAAATKK